MKRCYKCGETKPLTEFYKTKSRPDGLDNKCKTCSREAVRQYYQENRETIVERERQYKRDRKASQPACVYEIMNTINNKLYVGQTTRGEIRWIEHLSHLRGGYHGNPDLQADFNQYGEDVFEWRIIKEFKTKDEQLLITEESKIMNQYIDEGKSLYNVIFIKEVG